MISMNTYTSFFNLYPKLKPNQYEWVVMSQWGQHISPQWRLIRLLRCDYQFSSLYICFKWERWLDECVLCCDVWGSSPRHHIVTSHHKSHHHFLMSRYWCKVTARKLLPNYRLTGYISFFMLLLDFVICSGCCCRADDCCLVQFSLITNH